MNTKMKTTEFRIRPYSKRELAELYFPDTRQSATAVANLRNLMHRNRQLMQELQETGYRLHDKVFTPRQVRIITYYLGEP